MGFANTNDKKPLNGGFGAVLQPKGKVDKWISDLFNIGGEVLETGQEVINFVNENQDFFSENQDFTNEGGVKTSEGTEYAWWNPFTWGKWPWESDQPEAEQSTSWLKWLVIGVIAVLTYILITRATKGNSW